MVPGTFKCFTSALADTIRRRDCERKMNPTRAIEILVGLTWLAGACEAIDHVPTDAIVHTRVAFTVIYINLTVGPHVA